MLELWDANTKPVFVFGAPVANCGKSPQFPSISWHPGTFTLSVSLNDVNYPVSLVFGLGVQLVGPEVKGKSLSFGLGFGTLGWKKSGKKEEPESSDSDQEQKSRGLIFNFPSLEFGKSWKLFLFGKKGETGAKKLSESQDASLSVAPWGLAVSLSHLGVLRFGLQWKVDVSVSGFNLQSADLFSAAHFAFLHSPLGDIGFSFEKDAGKHFVNLSAPLADPKLALQFKV